MRHLPYIIIGAGISGLSLAYRLKKSGIDFLLIEQADKPGGNWQSHNYKSSIYEFGPNSFMNRSPELEGMIDTIGLRGQVLAHPFSQSRRYLYHKNKLIEVKSNPLAMLGSDLLSLESKLKIPFEIFLRNKSQSQDESVYDFFARRFGTEIANIADAALQGVWAGDSRKLSAKSALTKLYQAERKYGSILLGSILNARNYRHCEKRHKLVQSLARDSNPVSLQTCSFRDGMQSFCIAICDWLGADKILFNGTSKIIAKLNQGYKLEINGEIYTTDNLVISTKAFDAASLIEVLNPRLALALNSIYYAPVALFAYTLPKNIVKDTKSLFDKSPDARLASPRKRSLLGVNEHSEDEYNDADGTLQAGSKIFDAFGYINAKEDLLTLGTIFSSQLFPERELVDEYLLLSFAGGTKHKEVLDYSLEKLQKQIYEEQMTILNPYATKTLELNDFRPVNGKLIKRAIPQYSIGHTALESIIDEELKSLPGLTLLGNYRGGVAIADAVKQSFMHVTIKL